MNAKISRKQFLWQSLAGMAAFSTACDPSTPNQVDGGSSGGTMPGGTGGDTTGTATGAATSGGTATDTGSATTGAASTGTGTGAPGTSDDTTGGGGGGGSATDPTDTGAADTDGMTDTDGPIASACTTEMIVADISLNHGHRLEIPLADVDSGVEQIYDAQGDSTHCHQVILTADDFATLRAGGVVRKFSCNGGDHEYVLSCAPGAPAAVAPPECQPASTEGNECNN